MHRQTCEAVSEASFNCYDDLTRGVGHNSYIILQLHMQEGTRVVLQASLSLLSM